MAKKPKAAEAEQEPIEAAEDQAPEPVEEPVAEAAPEVEPDPAAAAPAPTSAPPTQYGEEYGPDAGIDSFAGGRELVEADKFETMAEAEIAALDAGMDPAFANTRPAKDHAYQQKPWCRV